MLGRKLLLDGMTIHKPLQAGYCCVNLLILLEAVGCEQEIVKMSVGERALITLPG